MRKILKQLIFKIKIIRDYFYFRTVYHSESGFWKFAWYQIFPYFKGKKYFPTDRRSTCFGNILVGKNSKVTQRGGCYIQGLGKVFIGDYVRIAQNCIVTSSNHDVLDHSKEIAKETIIGDYCWIASNACIMAGVVLGPRTVVGAGAVVTKSFPEGYCIIGGNPAKLLKTIDKDKFVRPQTADVEFYGYIRADKFSTYKAKHLGHLKFHYDLSKVTSNVELIRDSTIKEEL